MFEQNTEEEAGKKESSTVNVVKPEIASPTESVPVRATRSRSRRKPARPKCSSGGDDQVRPVSPLTTARPRRQPRCSECPVSCSMTKSISCLFLPCRAAELPIFHCYICGPFTQSFCISVCVSFDVCRHLVLNSATEINGIHLVTDAITNADFSVNRA